jgi:hypothetical protein
MGAAIGPLVLHEQRCVLAVLSRDRTCQNSYQGIDLLFFADRRLHIRYGRAWVLLVSNWT